MTAPQEVLRWCKRIGEVWAANPDTEYRNSMSAAFKEGIEGAPPEPPDEVDPPEDGKTSVEFEMGTVHLDREADVVLSILGDPIIVGTTNPTYDTLAELNPSPKNENRTALAQNDKETRWDPSLQAEGKALRPGSSVLLSEPHPANVERPRLKGAEVLSCAGTRPPVGCFRPPYVGGEVQFTSDDVDWGRLPKVELVGEPAANYSTGGGVPGKRNMPVGSMFQGGPWIDHMPNWYGRELHPTQNQPMDGKQIAQAVSLLTLRALVDPEPVQEALFGMVQYGIDLMGIVKKGGHNNWVSGGQHALGRLWPILFAGIVLDDEEMKMVRFRKPDVSFGEIRQTFHVTQEDINLGYGGYKQEHLGMAEWGNQHDRPVGFPGDFIGRQQDDVRWVFTPAEQRAEPTKWQHVRYRLDTIEYCMGWILAAKLMKAEPLVNHPALFNYAHRMWEMEKGARRIHPWVKAMWEKHA